MRGSFNLFPWDRPFLPLLKDFAEKNAGGDPPGALTIVFPHNRPRRYLMDLHRQEAVRGGKSTLPPRILTMDELFGLFGRASAARHAAAMPDLVMLLHGIVTAGGARGDLAALAGMDLDAFLPWGVRLAALFEECLRQTATPANLAHTQDLPPAATAILGGLGDIYAAYRRALDERAWTTPGLKAAEAAAAAGDPPLTLLPGRRVFLAGFVVLAGAEEAVLRALWERGAHVCLHTDAAGFAAGGPPGAPGGPHWSCQAHGAWIKAWEAKPAFPYEPSGHITKISYFSGHDLHSQLAELPAALPDDGRSTVVALSSDDLLMPTLHALPRKDVNISLGYPLERSPLCRLLESILRLHESRRADGRFHWRIVREVLRHPYLHMLAAGGETENAQENAPENAPENALENASKKASEKAPGGARAPEPLRPFFYDLERKLRTGRRFVYPIDIFAEMRQGLSPAAESVLERLFVCLFEKFAPEGAYGTLYSLGAAVEEMCDILLAHGGDIWRRFPIDAECFRRMRLGLIPLLKDSLPSRSPLSLKAAHQMLREGIKAERVPFEADPISGMQVLGMLETRLLHFERVVVLDATDAALPGSEPQSALLPDSLRPAVGLPPAHSRELAAAHTLHRLLRGASEACILWQDGESPLSGGRAERSRFVGEMIWQEEKRAKRIFKQGEPPLAGRVLPVRPFGLKRPALERAPAIDAALAALMAAPLSPTQLDAYISCPAGFVYSHVLKIEPRKEINEGDDPVEVGDIIHKALHEAYLPFEGREVRNEELDGERLAAIVRAKISESGLLENLPPESAIMLQMAAPARLRDFLERQPRGIRIMALEKTLQGVISCPAGDYAVGGKLDRLDARPDGLYVLDYKTGRAQLPERGVWTDQAFWAGVSAAAPDDTGALNELGAALNSLQLPCYILLTGQSPYGLARDAILADLRDKGEEIFLLGEDMDEHERGEAVTRRIPAAFSLVLAHMASARVFPAIKSKKCDWCKYKHICS